MVTSGGLGSTLLLLGVLASPWNALKFGGVQPGDILLALALALLLYGAARSRQPLVLPWWLNLLAALAGVVAIMQVFVPVSPSYVAQRFIIISYGGGGVDEPSQNLTNLLHWEVALVALPMAAVLASRFSAFFVRRLATAWLIGCTVSALVALTDRLGVTAISASLLPFVDISGRQAGLTSQPNNVAVAAAMALPVAVHWATRSATDPGASPRLLCYRVFGLGCVAVLLGGTWVAGSRGGAGAALVAVLVSLLATPGGRRLLPRLTIGAMIASPLLAVLLSSTWSDVQQSLRLGGDGSSVASDLGRAELARQAMHDFAQAPFRGIGLWVITESHSIYLQLLASGGLLLLIAFVVFLFNALRTGVTASRLTSDPFGRLMAISIGTWAIVGAVENQLTDRYLYIPAACIACLALNLTPATPTPPNPTPTPTPPNPTPNPSRDHARSGTRLELNPTRDHARIGTEVISGETPTAPAGDHRPTPRTRVIMHDSGPYRGVPLR